MRPYRGYLYGYMDGLGRMEIKDKYIVSGAFYKEHSLIISIFIMLVQIRKDKTETKLIAFPPKISKRSCYFNFYLLLQFTGYLIIYSVSFAPVGGILSSTQNRLNKETSNLYHLTTPSKVLFHSCECFLRNKFNFYLCYTI